MIFPADVTNLPLYYVLAKFFVVWQLLIAMSASVEIVTLKIPLFRQRGFFLPRKSMCKLFKKERKNLFLKSTFFQKDQLNLNIVLFQLIRRG